MSYERAKEARVLGSTQRVINVTTEVSPGTLDKCKGCIYYDLKHDPDERELLAKLGIIKQTGIIPESLCKIEQTALMDSKTERPNPTKLQLYSCVEEECTSYKIRETQ